MTPDGPSWKPASGPQRIVIPNCRRGWGGAPDAELGQDPHGDSSAGWVDYGEGWTLHGWAYPSIQDHSNETLTSTSWDGTQAFTWWPSWVWDLNNL